MRQLAGDEEAAQKMAFKLKMRQDAGLDPEMINKNMQKITQLTQSLIQVMTELAEKMNTTEVTNIVDMVQRLELGAVENLRVLLSHTITRRYLEACFPNALLGSKMLHDMAELASAGQFDAELIESEVIRVGREAAFQSLLGFGRRLLGGSRELHIDEKLPLRVQFDRSDHVVHDYCLLKLPVDQLVLIEALGKLSRVVLAGGDAATVQSNICGSILEGWWPVKVWEKEFVVKPGEPVKALRFFEDGTMYVSYETPEQAREMSLLLSLAEK